MMLRRGLAVAERCAAVERRCAAEGREAAERCCGGGRRKQRREAFAWLRLEDLRSHRIHFALPVTVTVTTIDLRGPNRRVPSSFRSSPGLLLSPPLTGCHRAAHKRLLLTPLTGAFFLPPLTGAFFLPLLTGPLLLPLLTGPLLLPPLTTSCSLVVVCFSKAAAFQSGEKTMQHGESIDDGENTHGQLPRLLEMSTMKNCEDVFGYIETRTVCKGKARDVKDLQSTSSSSVNDPAVAMWRRWLCRDGEAISGGRQVNFNIGILGSSGKVIGLLVPARRNTAGHFACGFGFAVKGVCFVR
ncbi:hypothetical protein E3N88_15332 [Mikania micrantha]|uniref:Uncharacterized protein n=1 Tax=Mikania micrantha TaxID=192012 RepID=A0A5N6NVR4_9ASTR|nr:hypothetical protein E3N88_15332 [Mikania micrantha]